MDGGGNILVRSFMHKSQQTQLINLPLYGICTPYEQSPSRNKNQLSRELILHYDV